MSPDAPELTAQWWPAWCPKVPCGAIAGGLLLLGAIVFLFVDSLVMVGCWPRVLHCLNRIMCL